MSDNIHACCTRRGNHLKNVTQGVSGGMSGMGGGTVLFTLEM